MKKMNSSRPTQGSFAAAVGEFDIDPDIYNEVGDVYGDKFPLEGTDLVKNSNKKMPQQVQKMQQTFLCQRMKAVAYFEIYLFLRYSMEKLESMFN